MSTLLLIAVLYAVFAALCLWFALAVCQLAARADREAARALHTREQETPLLIWRRR